MTGNRCPTCGQYEIVVVEHEVAMVDHLDDCPRMHAYCPNCDYGICCGVC